MRKSVKTKVGIASALATAAALLAGLNLAQASPIDPGHLVNIRVGDGITTRAGTAFPIHLDDYAVTYTNGAPTGLTLSQTIDLPIANGGGSNAIGQGGTAAGEGELSLSSDGNYMTLVGYNSAPGGTTNQAGSTEAGVVGIVTLSTGTVDTTTLPARVSAANAMRGGFSTDGSNIWLATSAQGIRYTTLGSATSTALTGTGIERRAFVYGGQLYTVRQSAPIDGPATVGTGTPTSGTQTVTLLAGFPTTNAGESCQDFFFADANTIYAVDDGGGSNFGLQKWKFSGSTWSLAYSKKAEGTLGLKTLTGFVDSLGQVVMFGANAATGATASNKLYGWADTLSNTDPLQVRESILRDSATDFGGIATTWNLRGVALAPGTINPVPEPGAFLLIGLAAPLALRRRRRA